MPTENPRANPALAGIQASTLAIFDERRRLNEAFTALQTAVSLIDPSAKLADDGSIHYDGVPAAPPPTPPGLTPAQIEKRDQAAAAAQDAEAAAQDAAAEAAEAKPPATQGSAPPPPRGPSPLSIERTKKLDELMADGERRSISRIASTINEPPEAIRYLMARLVDAGDYVRVDTQTGPVFFRAGSVTTKPLNQLDVAAAEGRREARAGGERPHSAPADAAAAEDPTTTPSKSGESSEARSDGGVAPPPPRTGTSPARVTGTATSGYGLARSPQPRESMRAQQREAEARKDSLVQWFMDQDRPRNAQDVEREFGVPMSTLGKDFRDLTKRGVLRRLEQMGYPEYKKGMTTQQMGRTSPFFTLAESSEATPTPKS